MKGGAMATVKFRQKGNFKKIYNLLEKYRLDYFGKPAIEKYAQAGLEALRSATPVDTGKTAASWYYRIEIEPELAKITYCNANLQNGANIAILLQYGHLTKDKGWVEGVDYINPAIQPVFDQIVEEAMTEIKKL